MAKQEFIITVDVSFTKKYIISAEDWEKAEDEAVDNAFCEAYSVYDSDCRIEVVDIERT